MSNICSRERPRLEARRKLSFFLCRLTFFVYLYSLWAEDGHSTALKFTHCRWNYSECLRFMTTNSPWRKQLVRLESESTHRTNQLHPHPLTACGPHEGKGSVPKTGRLLAYELDRDRKRCSPVRWRNAVTNTSVSHEEHQIQGWLPELVGLTVRIAHMQNSNIS